MPLGNLTSQFFANIYLNELDQFVKRKLNAKYYIRYVDDFVILHSDRHILVRYYEEINKFLTDKLDIELHPDKSKILCLGQRISFLEFRIFYYHNLLKKSNLEHMKKRLHILREEYINNKTGYDTIYGIFEGWFAYAKNADTYNLRKKIAVEIENSFPNEISTKEINRIAK